MVKSKKSKKNTNHIKSNLNKHLESKIFNIVKRYHSKSNQFKYIKKAVEKHTDFITEIFIIVKAHSNQIDIPIVGNYIKIKYANTHYLMTGYLKESSYSKLMVVAKWFGIWGFRGSKASILLLFNILATKIGAIVTFLSVFLSYLYYLFPGVFKAVYNVGHGVFKFNAHIPDTQTLEIYAILGENLFKGLGTVFRGR